MESIKMSLIIAFIAIIIFACVALEKYMQGPADTQKPVYLVSIEEDCKKSG
jgi:hypothetical protein